MTHKELASQPADNSPVDSNVIQIPNYNVIRDPGTPVKDIPPLPSTLKPSLSEKKKSRKGKRFYRIPWWIALLFTIGCLFFAIASALSYGKITNQRYLEISHINLAGATCFLLGGILGFVETFNKMPIQVVPGTIEDGHKLGDVSDRSDSESAKPESIDIWITSMTLAGAIFFEVPAIVGYFYNSEWVWHEKLLYVNLHTILGVIFFDGYSVLTFYKLRDSFKWYKLSFYAPFLYFVGGMPFVVYAVLATLDHYYQTEAVTMSLIGSVLYLVGSIVMMVEIGLSDDDDY